jgi:hypothetical protein
LLPEPPHNTVEYRMGHIEASLLTALWALSAAAGCKRPDGDSHARSRTDDQATIVINAPRPSPGQEAPLGQAPEEPPPREPVRTIVIEPHAALEPAKIESVVAPIELAPVRALSPQTNAAVGPAIPRQASAAVARASPLEGVTSPSADNANLSAVANELSDLLRDLTAPGGKAAPDSPLMNSIQSGKAPRPTPPSSEGR